jgi:hypothetical protein
VVPRIHLKTYLSLGCLEEGIQVGEAARAEEASGEALCGVRRANDGSLACGASRRVSSDQREVGT